VSTKIEWTDATWNPIRARRRSDGKVGWHCVKVNDACRNCYAEHQNIVAGTNRGRHGNGVPYAADKLPLVEYFLDEKTLQQPLHWKQPRKVFPCSMTDLYSQEVPWAWVDQIYSVMAATPQHFYIVLTKRSDQRKLFLRHPTTKRNVLGAVDGPWPLPNVIEMASFGRQKDADVEMPLLLQTPAAMRGASVEPMLEAVNLEAAAGISLWCTKLNWIICGGESGSQARPFNLAWAESLREQCKAAGVPFFMKQVGSCPKRWITPILGSETLLHCPALPIKDRKGGDPSEWPESLRVREWPTILTSGPELALTR